MLDIIRYLIILLATHYAIVHSQPIPKTGWEVINVAKVPSSGYTFARVATFMNGDYIVVYPITYGSIDTSIAAQIFAADGTSIVAEFRVSGSGNYTAPNVITFSDNT